MSQGVVDTHCHVGLHKYEPVESLLFHMEQAQVGQAVLIQYMGNADNSYIVECLERHPGRFCAAMIVAPEDDGSQVRRWAEQGLGGIRLRPDARATGADSLAQWRAAAELDLVVSTLCSPEALLGAAFTEVLAAFPDLRVVIEHLGGIGVGAEPPYETYKEVLQLAQRPNLSIKLPGFGEFCAPPHPFASVPPLAEMAIEAFGPQRVMWGSDYPPVSSREGYANSLEFPRSYLSDYSEAERAWIFGDAARAVWSF